MPNFKQILIVLALIVLCSASSHGTVHNITVGNFFFSPQGTTVQYGDTVRWTWDGGVPHSTTSTGDSPLSWDSGVHSDAGYTFELIIQASAGSGPFPYLCVVHTSMTDTIWVDNDNDGATADIDCHDGDPSIFPGATETPDDGIDQDCNGFDAVTCFVDSDQDGFGSTTTSTSLDGTCGLGFSENNEDCHDGDPTIFPGATEIPGDGIDQDCNGVDAVNCWPDTDNDGFGDASASPILSDGDCGNGFVNNNGDCDDTDPNLTTSCGCCVGDRGNMDGDSEDLVDISDLVYMVDYQFRNGDAPPCFEEADIAPGLGAGGPDGLIDISDLVAMVDYQFRNGDAPPPCP